MSALAKIGDMSPTAGLSLFSWAGHLVIVWLLGLSLGWLGGVLLPRPKWLRSEMNAKQAFMMTIPGMWLRRALLTWNGFLIVREVWYLRFSPGSFRAILRSLWNTLTKGQRFTWPERNIGQKGDVERAAAASAALADPLSWYVSTADLEFCRDAIERDVGPKWEEMLKKEWPGCTYKAFRRSLPNGKTEYKSTTVYEDATAQEFMDFYLDDNMRPKWDAMISEHQLLDSAHDLAHRCQVVRWVRTFPFAFISRREYVIARRMFRLYNGKDTQNPDLYGITKGIDHPAAPRADGLVRMTTFYSMWRSRTVPCPKGTGRPACETTLLHFEDFGIPENLARFAVRHGMANFVSKMVPFVGSFVQERRNRCGPLEDDNEAYGAGMIPVANILRKKSLSLDSCSSLPSTSGSEDGFVDDSASELSGQAPRRTSSRRGLGYMLVASGVALALSKVGSSDSLNGQMVQGTFEKTSIRKGVPSASAAHEGPESRRSHRGHHPHHALHHALRGQHTRHGHRHQNLHHHRMHALHAHKRGHSVVPIQSHRVSIPQTSGGDE